MIHVFIILGVLIALYYIASLFEKKLRNNVNLSIVAVLYLICGWIFIGEPFAFLTGITVLIFILSEYFTKNQKLKTLFSVLEILIFSAVIGTYAYHHFVNLLIQYTQ